jgi:hypothetical protein
MGGWRGSLKGPIRHVKENVDVDCLAERLGASNSYIVIVMSGLCYFITTPLLFFSLTHLFLPSPPTTSHPSQSSLHQTSSVVSELGFTCPMGKATEGGAPGQEVELCRH